MADFVYVIGNYDDGEPLHIQVTQSPSRAIELVKERVGSYYPEDVAEAVRMATEFIAKAESGDPSIKPSEASRAENACCQLQRGWGGVIISVAEMS